MKVRSVCVSFMACTMLLMTAQTDLAFASLAAVRTSSTELSITSASWAVVAGANSSATATGAYGPITPWSQSCTNTASPAITKKQTTSWNNRKASFTNVTGLRVGYIIIGARPSSPSTTYRIKAIVGNQVEVDSGGNSPNSSNNTTLTFEVAKRVNGSNWENYLGVVDATVNVDEATDDLSTGMTVSGSGITNSGSNTILLLNYGGVNNKKITLAQGLNTSADSTILTFDSFVTTCTDSYNEFFSVNNTGTVDVAKVALTESSGTVVIQSCNTGGVGTPYAAWDEGARTCGGVINTVVTDGLSHTLSVLAGGTVRLRALSSSGNTSTSISVSVSTSDLRSPTNTNQ